MPRLLRSVRSAAASMVDTPAENSYRILAATMRDVYTIRRLERFVFPLDAYSYLSLSTLLMMPGGSNYKAVDARGNVVGFVAGSPNWGTHVDWIVTLGVHPDHRRCGLGRRLLAVCEKNLTQPTIRLTVRVSNGAAIRLYESASYRRIYVEPHYYSDGESGIVMEKCK
jgi:ribosomal protein S18 acetylase RimI-like enzyme